MRFEWHVNVELYTYSARPPIGAVLRLVQYPHMHRPFILGLAGLAMFFALVTVIPLLEQDADATQAAAVYVPLQPSLPSCAISIRPEVIERGEEASLAWTADNVTDVFLDSAEVLPEDGRFVRPTGSRTYTLTVYSASGHINSCSTSITVL